jgi:LysM repeat protein
MRRYLAALVFALLLPLPALAAQVKVQTGETLSEIADRHGVSLSKLMELNGISKADHIEVGQVLRLPANARGVSGGKGAGGGATGTVRVLEGDTLSDIAARQGMDLDRLMAMNGISKADHIEVGQMLKVTGKPAPPAPSYRRGASVHVVRPGESLSEIADGYGVAMSRLVAINQLDDPDHVESGRRLKLTGPIPSPRPTTASAPARPITPTPRPVAQTAPAPVMSAAQPAVAAAPAPRPTAPVVASIAPAAEQTVATATSRAASSSGFAAVAPRPAAATLASAAPARSAFPAAAAASPAFATATATVASPAATTMPTRTTAAVATRTAIPATTPIATPVASRTVTPAAAPAAAATSAAISRLDWRRYGPLQVDWSGWQPMGGSLVAPVMNAKGDTLYLAINCGARKLNATSAAGDWRTWDNPQADFEQRLVNDLCRSRGS